MQAGTEPGRDEPSRVRPATTLDVTASEDRSERSNRVRSGRVLSTHTVRLEEEEHDTKQSIIYIYFFFALTNHRFGRLATAFGMDVLHQEQLLRPHLRRAEARRGELIHHVMEATCSSSLFELGFAGYGRLSAGGASGLTGAGPKCLEWGLEVRLGRTPPHPAPPALTIKRPVEAKL